MPDTPPPLVVVPSPPVDTLHALLGVFGRLIVGVEAFASGSAFGRALAVAAGYLGLFGAVVGMILAHYFAAFWPWLGATSLVSLAVTAIVVAKDSIVSLRATVRAMLASVGL